MKKILFEYTYKSTYVKGNQDKCVHYIIMSTQTALKIDPAQPAYVQTTKSKYHLLAYIFKAWLHDTLH